MTERHAAVVATIPSTLPALVGGLSQTHSQASCRHQGGFGVPRFLLAQTFNQSQHGAS